jgi:hypothetical protein
MATQSRNGSGSNNKGNSSYCPGVNSRTGERAAEEFQRAARERNIGHRGRRDIIG